MDAASSRATRFEIMTIAQGPNSYLVRAAERGVFGVPVEVDLHQDLFTTAELAQLHAAFGLLEEKLGAEYDAKLAKPEDMKAVINEATQAKAVINAATQAKKDLEASTLARAQLEAETIARRADLDAKLDAKRKEADQLAADLATMRAAVEAAKTTTDETTKTE